MKQPHIFNYLFVSIISILGFTFVGCEKDDPEPKVEEVPDVYSFNYSITTWGYDGEFAYVDIDAADGLIIPESVINSGALLAYIETGSGLAPIPYSHFFGGGEMQLYRGYFSINRFLLRIKNSDGSSPYPPMLTASTSSPRLIRIVLIPQRKMIPGVNINNYEDVKVAYNLDD